MKGKIRLIAVLAYLFICSSRVPAGANEKTFPLSITVRVDERLPIDTLSILFTNSAFQTPYSEKDIRYFEKTGPHTFRFATREPVSGGHFAIQSNPPAGSAWEKNNLRFLTITPTFWWEAGDSISLSVTKRHSSAGLSGNYLIDYQYEFKGSGSEKYTIWEKMLSPPKRPLPADTTDCRNLILPKISASLEVLESGKAALSNFQYQMLKAELIAKQREIFQRIRRPQQHISLCDSLLREGIKEGKAALGIDLITSGIPASVACRSENYLNYLLERLLFEAYSEKAASRPFDLLSVIVERYEAPLRDTLLLLLFIKDIPDEDLYGNYLRAKELITDPECLRALNEIVRTLPGMPVADFSLPDPDGKLVSLSSFKGKVTFIDLWFTGCGACVSYYRDVLREAEEQLKDEKDIVFISISVDKNPTLWKKSISSGKYTSVHAVNLYTEGKGVAHDWTTHYGFHGCPKFMIVDRGGKIHRIFNNGFANEISSTGSLVTRLKKVLMEE